MNAKVDLILTQNQDTRLAEKLCDEAYRGVPTALIRLEQLTAPPTAEHYLLTVPADTPLFELKQRCYVAGLTVNGVFAFVTAEDLTGSQENHWQTAPMIVLDELTEETAATVRMLNPDAPLTHLKQHGFVLLTVAERATNVNRNTFRRGHSHHAVQRDETDFELLTVTTDNIFGGDDLRLLFCLLSEGQGGTVLRARALLPTEKGWSRGEYLYGLHELYTAVPQRQGTVLMAGHHLDARYWQTVLTGEVGHSPQKQV